MINLVRQLPEGSRTDRSIRGEAAEWGLDAHLLRTATNALIAANYQRAQKRAPAGSFIDPPNGSLASKPDQTKTDTEPVGGAAELDKMFTG